MEPYGEHKTYLNNNGYNILTKYLTKEQIKKIEVDLTVTPNIPDATREELDQATYEVYSYSDDNKAIIVPRYYGVSRFGQPEHTDFEEAEEIDIEFIKKLRPKQQTVTDLCVKYMVQNGGGLLSVPCGFGKTVCALYIAQKLGLKTLVVVHKSFLLNQWVERAVEFLNIRKENIGIIRQSKCDIEGKDIVIGIIHTMSKREYNEFYRQFGLVIYDEAHHVAAKYFSRTLMKTSSNYTLALTATPYRGDGLIKVMYWFTGGTIYREKMKMNVNVAVKTITHCSTDPKFKTTLKWFRGNIKPSSQITCSNIMDIKSRNDMIIKMITYIRRNSPERKILVLSEQLKHLKYLKERVDNLIQKDIDAGKIEEDDVYSCYYIGETKLVQRQEAEERGDIIFATYHMASEGLDIKHLNTLILASPKKDIVQTVGRIMRTILKAGDVRPLIIDIQDDLPLFAKWSKFRNEHYDKCKYQIEEYYLKDKKFMSGNRYYDLDNIEDEDRPMHHESMGIHKLINDNNQEYQEWKCQLREFEDLCAKIEYKQKYKKSVSKNSRSRNRTGKDNNYYKKQNMFANSSLSESSSGSDSDYKSDPLEATPIMLTDSELDEKYGLTDFEIEHNMSVLEDFEPYKLADVLHVDKLTDNDFQSIVLKNAGIDSNKLDLEKDMNLDPEDMEDEMMRYKGQAEIKTLAQKLRVKRLV